MVKVTSELTEQSLEQQKAFADRLAKGKASRKDYRNVTLAGIAFLVFLGITVAFVLMALLGRLPLSAGPLRPPPWGGLSLILKIFPLWLFVSIAAGELCGAVLALSPSLAGLRIIMILSGISNAAVVVALVVVLRFEYGAGRDDFGFPRERIIPTAVLGVFLILALQLPVLFLKLGWMQVLDGLDVAQDINAVFVYMHDSPSPYNAFLLFPVIAIIVPIGEEFIFRGLLYGGLRRVMGAGAAIIISAILFAAVHDAWSDRVPLFVLGAAFAWLYERTRSLVAPIAAHAVNNAIALTQFYLLN
jgi:membrane protease YdiL (CAAX protease family)